MKRQSGQEKMIVVTGNPMIAAMKILARDQGVGFLFFLFGVYILSCFFEHTSTGLLFSIYLTDLNTAKNCWLNSLDLNGFLLKVKVLLSGITIGKILFISIACLCFEKIGFFACHISIAFGVWTRNRWLYKWYINQSNRLYRRIIDSRLLELIKISERIKTQEENLGFWFYQKNALRGGLKSTIQDISIHDFSSGFFMFLGLTYSSFPKLIVSLSSYFGGLVVVVLVDFFIKILLYCKLSRYLGRVGFKSERYFEARFKIGRRKAEKLFKNIASEYGLGSIVKDGDGGYKTIPNTVMCGLYADKYFSAADKLNGYNGRKPRIRVRRRDSGLNDGIIKRSFQLIFTRVSQLDKKETSQYNFFVIEKNKFSFGLKLDRDLFAENFCERLSKVFKKLSKGKEVVREKEFKRKAAGSIDKVLISIDQMENSKVVFEIKAYPKYVPLLKEVMEKVMNEGAIQITLSKDQLIFM